MNNNKFNHKEEYKKTTIYIPKDLYRRFKIFSVYEDKTLSELITEALKEYLEEHEY